MREAGLALVPGHYSFTAILNTKKRREQEITMIQRIQCYKTAGRGNKKNFVFVQSIYSL